MSRYQTALVVGLVAVAVLAVLRVVAVAHGGMLDDVSAAAFTAIVTVFVGLLAAGHFNGYVK